MGSELASTSDLSWIEFQQLIENAGKFAIFGEQGLVSGDAIDLHIGRPINGERSPQGLVIPASLSKFPPGIHRIGRLTLMSNPYDNVATLIKASSFCIDNSRALRPPGIYIMQRSPATCYDDRDTAIVAPTVRRLPTIPEYAVNSDIDETVVFPGDLIGITDGSVNGKSGRANLLCVIQPQYANPDLKSLRIQVSLP